MTDSSNLDPRTFYDRYGSKEWERLDRDFFHRLEWEGTVDQLRTALPTPSADATDRVLDVGAGAGRYSVWLAERGYDVVAVEPSETQRALAREQLLERGLTDRVTIAAGDVRSLSLAPDAVDACCCLGGPLSHVLDDDHRRTAVQELARVTKPGGPVFVSVMGLLGMALITVQYAGRGDDDDGLALLPELVVTQEYTAQLVRDHGVTPFMAETHFFRRAELAQLLVSGGLEVEEVLALEGVAACRRSHFDALDETARERIRSVNDTLRTDPTIADISPHMLAVCRA